jgi:hypothetical protein
MAARPDEAWREAAGPEGAPPPVEAMGDLLEDLAQLFVDLLLAGKLAGIPVEDGAASAEVPSETPAP